MNFISLELNNFRQYYGKQIINFSSSNIHNVVIILGENGNGKTGIFRAINFCLFGDLQLDKDTTSESKNVHLVNFLALENNKNRPVEGYVRVVFAHKNLVYDIKRSTYDILRSNRSIEPNIQSAVYLSITNNETNETTINTTNSSEAAKYIEGVLSSKIKDLFFFDGDKIETLNQKGDASRLEIKNGVSKLLDIDVIKNIEKILESKKQSLTREVNKNANTKVINSKNKYTNIQNSISEKKVELEQVQSYIDNINNQIEEYDRILNKDENIQKLNDDLKDYIEKENSLAELVTAKEEKIKDFLYLQSYHIMNLQLYKETLEKLNSFEIDNNVDSRYTCDLIKDMLENHKCICGKCLDDNDEFYIRLEKLKDIQEKNEVVDFVRDFKRKLSNYIDSSQKNIEAINEKVDNLSDVIKRREENKRLIDATKFEINNAALSNTQEKIANAKKERALKQETLERKKTELTSINNEIETLTNEANALKKEIDKYKNEDRRIQAKANKRDVYSDLCLAFSNLENKYSSNMRERLSIEATNLFNKFIASKDAKMIEKIEVHDNYDISTKAIRGLDLSKDLATGQNQVMSLAFVTALAKIASNANGEENVLPLFMDTPFAKLDKNNRKNLLIEIPKLTSQWILLVTNTEYTDYEASILKSEKRISDIFKIKKIEDGYSVIRRIDENSEESEAVANA